nr:MULTISPECIES: polysaccharide biosynthesis C-terminal domain-containing protein [unclassified Enterococcus]
MNQVLFKDNRGIKAISYYLLAIFLLSMIQVLHHHYEIARRRKVNIWFLSAGLLSKLLLTYFLTKSYGIFGSSISTIISLFIVFLCYFISEYQYFYFKVKFICLLILMSGIVRIAEGLLTFNTRFGMLFEVILLSTLGAAFLIVCLLKLKVICWDELK